MTFFFVVAYAMKDNGVTTSLKVKVTLHLKSVFGFQNSPPFGLLTEISSCGQNVFSGWMDEWIDFS